MILLGISLAAWALALLALFGLLSLAGSLPLDLYGFYSLAAAVGWVAGNVYVQRARDRPRPLRRRMLLAYLFGPPGLLFLARAMAPAAAQAAAPLVPTYGFGVFAVFFLVPVTLKGAFRG